MYDLLLKGGEVIDPARGLHGVMDVAVREGRIAAVSEALDTAESREVIPLDGRLVVPGLIDMHCHPGVIDLGTVKPDDIGIMTGVTTLCEGGDTGPGNFYPLRRHEIETAETDMFCYINVAVTGLAAFPHPEIRGDEDMDADAVRRVVGSNRDVIRGIKIRAMQPLADSVGIAAVNTARDLARETGLPLVVHIGEGCDRVGSDTIDGFTRDVVAMLDAGDVLAHFLTGEAGGMILPDGTIYPELVTARDRGVILDACTGRTHLSFKAARHALAQGLAPSVISTDANASNLSDVQSLLVTMSKFLNLGLSVEQVVAMTTANPARVLGEQERRGSLKPGMPADVTILEVIEGDFLFSEGKAGHTLKGQHLIEPRLVLKNGRTHPCLSRYRLPCSKGDS